MCGIIAVVRRFSERAPAGAEWVESALVEALRAVETGVVGDVAEAFDNAAGQVETVDVALRGTAGVRCLLGAEDLAATVDEVVGRIERHAVDAERRVDEDASLLGGRDPERFNAALTRLKDAAWAVRHDRLRTARAVAELAGANPGRAAIEAFTSVQIALSALDRLEVRGRDSAGVHLLVDGHSLDLDAPDVRSALDERSHDRLFPSNAVRVADGCLSFVYKAAAEIGELGDNTRVLREAIVADELLHRALVGETAQCTVLGHTRWASVGIISQANAHPLNQEEAAGPDRPYVVAALNGDVDNYAELRERAGLSIPPEITTDAKVIPALVARGIGAGEQPADAFRAAVAQFDGSTAIGASTAARPGEVLLALRGSGQALYVGLAEDAYIVASEPYGLVEETSSYVRMDGEREAPNGVRGEVVAIDRADAGSLEGIRRVAYDGTSLPVSADEVMVASITTRDIDRGAYPHFLLKELTEAPYSFRKTLRGKIEEEHGRLRARVGDEALPPDIGERVRTGDLSQVLVIGQGTAAVAGKAVAGFLADALDHCNTRVLALPATELSGFGLDDDMADTLVVAISQSGTTTDTNRTVDLARARGATVVSIVNRRNSDLVEKSHGVLYTSDGRDVEMSVPSTKAFYAQIAAGVLLAASLAEASGGSVSDTSELLDSLRELPDAMETVLSQRPAIADAAHRLAPGRRHWAVVGNGANRVAAEEVRIKLSELCYKSIACDATEDKKHIDLAAEPLVIVCAAGLSDANADDVGKEVAIYRAHKAAPIVIATDGDESKFQAAMAVLSVPAVHPALAFVLSAMAGHVFGYEAALAIDAQALPFRQARAAIESAASRTSDADRVLLELGRELDPLAARFMDDLRAGSYNGSLEASTAVRVASLLRYATGIVPLDAYQLEYGQVGTPSVVVQDLTDALTKAIEELTRPIDAIKHQAKTVTVGISRSEDALLETALAQQLLAAGAVRDRLSYRTLRTIAALDPAVAEVTGYTTYRIDGSVTDGTATIHVVDQSGNVPASRTTRDPRLKGTKHRVASDPEVTVARGRSDGRTIILVPETKDKQTTGMTVLHTRFHDRLEPAVARKVLEGYRGRYAILKDAVTETEPTFDDTVLAEIPMIDLLEQPLHQLADIWRKP